MLQGAVGGLLATLPMTIFMLMAWKRLPEREKYPLPPRLITRNVVKQVESPQRLGNRNLTALTLLLHFLYGALTGSLYGTFEQRIPLDRSLKGSLYGVSVWVGSYLGWIPALGILSPATKHPWRRNVLMIASHLVWGTSLGVFTRLLDTHSLSVNQKYIDIE
jgi:uncharacterized membrane protein YagU involved in acid resistance